MTQQSIQHEIDAEKARQSRIDAQRAVCPPHQMKRLETAQREAELALARVYGHRLDPRVCGRIIEGMILSPEVLCTIGGGANELPTDAKGWDRWARDAANEEPLAKLSIEHSDAQLREEIRRTVLESIRPEQRLQMARAGTLDAHVEDEVKVKLEDRSGV